MSLQPGQRRIIKLFMYPDGWEYEILKVNRCTVRLKNDWLQALTVRHEWIELLDGMPYLHHAPV